MLSLITKSSMKSGILYTFKHHFRKIWFLSKMPRTRQTMEVITVAWLISGT